jgi:hypothetical protein
MNRMLGWGFDVEESSRANRRAMVNRSVVAQTLTLSLEAIPGSAGRSPANTKDNANDSFFCYLVVGKKISHVIYLSATVIYVWTGHSREPLAMRSVEETWLNKPTEQRHC